jgi:hypothetical protein
MPPLIPLHPNVSLSPAKLERFAREVLTSA